MSMFEQITSQRVLMPDTEESGGDNSDGLPVEGGGSGDLAGADGSEMPDTVGPGCIPVDTQARGFNAGRNFMEHEGGDEVSPTWQKPDDWDKYLELLKQYTEPKTGLTSPFSSSPLSWKKNASNISSLPSFWAIANGYEIERLNNEEPLKNRIKPYAQDHSNGYVVQYYARDDNNLKYRLAMHAMTKFMMKYGPNDLPKIVSTDKNFIQASLSQMVFLLTDPVYMNGKPLTMQEAQSKLYHKYGDNPQVKNQIKDVCDRCLRSRSTTNEKLTTQMPEVKDFLVDNGYMATAPSNVQTSKADHWTQIFGSSLAGKQRIEPKPVDLNPSKRTWMDNLFGKRVSSSSIPVLEPESVGAPAPADASAAASDPAAAAASDPAAASAPADAPADASADASAADPAAASENVTTARVSPHRKSVIQDMASKMFNAMKNAITANRFFTTRQASQQNQPAVASTSNSSPDQP